MSKEKDRKNNKIGASHLPNSPKTQVFMMIGLVTQLKISMSYLRTFLNMRKVQYKKWKYKSL